MALRQIEVEAVDETEARSRVAEILAAGDDPTAELVSIRDSHYIGSVVDNNQRVRVSLWRGYVRDGAPNHVDKDTSLADAAPTRRGWRLSR